MLGLHVATLALIGLTALGTEHSALSTEHPAPGATQSGGTPRLATNAEALVASPVFFHGKQIAVRREVEPAGQLVRLAGTAKPVFVVFRERPTVTSESEVRGEFWDIGRLERNDSRIAHVDVQPMLDQASNGQWPGRDQVFMILGA